MVACWKIGSYLAWSSHSWVMSWFNSLYNPVMASEWVVNALTNSPDISTPSIAMHKVRASSASFNLSRTDGAMDTISWDTLIEIWTYSLKYWQVPDQLQTSTMHTIPFVCVSKLEDRSYQNHVQKKQNGWFKPFAGYTHYSYVNILGWSRIAHKLTYTDTILNTIWQIHKND